MKTYQCHKRVKAARILSVPTLPPKDCIIKGILLLSIDGPNHHIVTAEWLEKHKPHVGGYLVVYQDGYESFLPAEVFEAGYTEVPVEKVNVCDVDCHTGAPGCNGCCTGKTGHPPAADTTDRPVD